MPISLTHLFGGLLKSTVYGVLIALSGCLRDYSAAKAPQPLATRPLRPWLQASLPL